MRYRSTTNDAVSKTPFSQLPRIRTNRVSLSTTTTTTTTTTIFEILLLLKIWVQPITIVMLIIMVTVATAAKNRIHNSEHNPNSHNPVMVFPQEGTYTAMDTTTLSFHHVDSK
jgi:hypothetical protein